MILNGREYLYFAGTSYFQLHAHPELIRAANRATGEYGIGSATTRSMTGNTPLLEQVEKKLSAFFDSEDAVYLPSGYLSSLAGIQALRDMQRCQIIFLDEASHDSLAEGARASGLPVIPFRHRDAGDLEEKMRRHLDHGQHPLVASDGLFPATAALAPVKAYMDLARHYRGVVWIDDAHCVGTLGARGRGTREIRAIRSPGFYMGATLSKAFGAYGGFICGDEDFTGTIRAGSVYSCSSAPVNAAVAASIRGIELLQENPALRKKLWENARYLRESLSHLGIKLEYPDIPSRHGCIPVASFMHGNARSMRAVQHFLMERGIFIQHTFYNGSGKEGLLRVVVSSSHEKAEIDLLRETLGEAMNHVSA